MGKNARHHRYSATDTRKSYHTELLDWWSNTDGDTDAHTTPVHIQYSTFFWVIEAVGPSEVVADHVLGGKGH